MTGILEPSSALNQVNDQDDDGNYEQEMDQAAANVANETKKPENDQNDNYSPEHGQCFPRSQISHVFLTLYNLLRWNGV